MFENDPVEGSKLLLVLHRNWLIELLNMDLDISHLLFVDSWRCPESLLPCKVLKTILESDSCKNQGLIAFEGCITTTHHTGDRTGQHTINFNNTRNTKGDTLGIKSITQH